MQDSTSDRISYLPNDVIEKILTCMPTKDAVRTSVLSKKWRYNWVTIPKLEFDYAFYEKSITTRESWTTSTNEFVLTICQVLLLHRGPILKFKLQLSALENCSAVDQLIPLVSINGVRDLTLDIMSDEPYELPSSLFSCVQLEHLELHDCLFVPPPRFNGFSKLHSLELHEVIITSEVFSGLISNCPLLKELKLVDPASFSDLEITAPNLHSLYYKGNFSYIWLKNAPNLARVSIHFPCLMNKVNVSKWVTLFAGLPAVEFLELEYFRLKLFPQSDIPRKLPVDLSNLKILNLDATLGSVCAVSSILCLIRSSPNLEKIKIRDLTDHILIMPTLEHFEEQGLLDIYLNRLRKVDLHMACNQGFQLEFVKFLLDTSPILEKMVIQQIYAMNHRRLMFWKAVTQFRRLSPLAEVFIKF
ncbi:F-box/FBD/LRR-repeat protein At1g13570-like [Diospyros lotus]|uniref:F-box/FBD/LRR-repeat protein At1g13570-like n=1 Tax=Diospyros lotus TaxID=55363 RepID=UPI002251E50E|nr:F-box/FBD/LRR-repeat protein At1g13570-like [Diospyros lotus]XP_052209117.1 F-box/FBD/LRR-repeat protein At1g13570-like [Diospyros lotus]